MRLWLAKVSTRAISYLYHLHTGLLRVGMNTTAGSYALLKSVVPGDATVAAKLRKAGAILLGKANLVRITFIEDLLRTQHIYPIVGMGKLPR